jgi:two-component system OmpR family sensor kinase
MRWRWFLIGLAIPIPAVVGIGASVLVNLAFPADEIPNVYVQADAAALASMGGFLLSLVIGLVLAIVLRRKRLVARFQAEIEHNREMAAADRRRFLRRLDHELKNPLTAIRAGLANLSVGDPGDTQPESLNSVEAQALRISRLVADLRKLAELETRPLEFAPVDVAALLDEAVDAVRSLPETGDRRITLTVPQAPWPLPHVPGDRDLLFLAIYNLLDNARKFTAAGDTMEVRASEDGAMVVVEVADTGPGIPEEDIPHVWEELYRGKGARGISGSGLGLALVRAIIERHGGQAKVRSRAGQGTVFTLQLPTK